MTTFETLASPVCDYPCPADSFTLTAAMQSTFAAIPSNTPPPWATVVPAVGDLGWGAVYGTIRDGLTSRPLDGATVTCQHFSYNSPYRCDGVTFTDRAGAFIFTPVFFHDTDRITLFIDAPGYTPLEFEQTSFTRAEFHADLGLFPADVTPSPTPYTLMCTQPACPGGVLVCGSSSGCLGGCGAVCVPFTPTP
jgi:hypothetical protein